MKVTATLLALGLLLAAVVTWLIGVFAAIAFTKQALVVIRATPLLPELLFGVAMNALPAFAISLIFGLAIQAAFNLPSLAAVWVAAVPWLVLTVVSLVFPPFSDAPTLEHLPIFLSWQPWPPVLAVPLGLLSGARLVNVVRAHRQRVASAA